MEQLELYSSVFFRYMELYSSGRQPSAFNAYCRDRGLDPRLMRQIIMEKFPDEEIPSGRNSMGQVYLRIYEDFKNLCSEGGQPGPFAAYCRERGVSWARMHYYMKGRGLKVTGLPGYTKLPGHAKRPGHTRLPATGSGKYREVPFEDVIFEEAGFLPDNENTPDLSKGYVVPMLPVEAFAGNLQLWSQGVQLKDCEKVVSPVPGVDFGIRVSGNSMEPEFQNGSVLFIKRINEKAFIPWGNPMVIDTENGVVVKVVYPVNEEGARPDRDCRFIEAHSYNPAYPPFLIPTESIYGLYRIITGIRQYSTL